jgi:serine/threonine protein kinase
LLAIGKFDLKSDDYSNYEKMILKPMISERVREHLRGGEKIIKTDENILNNITLSDFTVIKCLGTGGFSSVFLVQCGFNGKYYAMKLVDKKFILENEREGIVEN